MRAGHVLTILMGLAGLGAIPEATAQSTVVTDPGARAPLADPRVAAWSADMNAGRAQASAAAIARDLSSATPHPFAAHAWIMVQRKLGNSIDAAVAAVPEPARALVAREAAIWRAADGNRWSELSALAGTTGIPEAISPWAIEAIWRAAQAMGQPDAMYAAVEAMLLRYPESLAGGNLGRLMLGAYAAPLHRERLERLANRPELAQSPGAAFLRRALADRSMDAPDRAAIAAALWQPGTDWFADSYVGLVACDQSWFARCRALRESAARAYPFASDRAEPLLAAVFRDEGATAMEQRLAVMVRGAVDPVLAGHRDRARALFVAGEHGAARRALDAGLKSYPDDIDLLVQMAALEKADGRHAQASTLYRRLVGGDPGNADYWNQLLEIHDAAEDFDGAETIWNDAVAALKSPIPDPGLANRWMHVLIKRNESAHAIAVGQQVAAQAPAFGWTWRNLADAYLKLGKQDAAQAMLERAHVENGVSRWTADRMAEIADAKAAGGGDAALAALAEAYPFVRAIVDAQNERAGKGKDSLDPAVVAARAALARGAVARAPTAFWPHYYLGFYEARRGALAASDAAFAAGLAALPEDAAGRRASLLLERSRERLRSGNPRRDADAIAGDLALAATLGAERGDLLMRELDLHAKTGQSEKAAAALALMAQVAPDGPAVDEVFTRSDPAFSAIRNRAFAVLARYIDRKPYDPLRLQAGAFRHVMWGGSPVLGLEFVQRMEEASPTTYRTSRAPGYRERALGDLGAHQAHFRAAYDGKTGGPCCSQLYDNMFADARTKAQGTSAFILQDRIDFTTKRAIVITADGIEIERGYHPISGRLTYYRVGGADMKAEYDAEGRNLLGITDSGGLSLRLDYDASDKITHYTTIKGEVLRFEYGPLGKPTVIDMGKAGRIAVTYDDKGNILTTEASGGSGNSSSVSLAITRAFSDLQRMIAAFTQATLDVPELPYEDPVRTKLIDMRNAVRGDAAHDAELRLAQHEVANVAKRRAYAIEATRRIRDLLDAARADGADARRVRIGLDAAALWIDLNTRLYRHGQPIDVWRTTGQLRDWLADLARQGRETKRVARLQADLTARGGTLLDSARWLPRSYLSNTAFWRRFGPEAVLPRAINGPVAASAVLIRANGDVVVGSPAGLSVYRRGFWEWYSWDANKRRFSADLPAASARSRPHVRALSEDRDGHLWVALDDGLVLLAEEYAGRAARFASEIQNLTRAPIGQLVALPGGVLAGSDKGLRLFNPTGNAPLPAPLAQFADTRISLLRLDMAPGKDLRLLIGTPAGLFAFDGARLARIGGAVDDAVLAGDQILTLRANEVRLATWTAGGAIEPQPVPDQANIVYARRIDGLGTVEIEGGVIAPAVLTDQGASIWHDGHFEHLRLPLADREVGVLRSGARGGQTAMATSDGVYVAERSRVVTATPGRVYDILSMRRFGATMIAYGGRIDALPHNSTDSVPLRFASLRARVLAEAPDGSLITHDGTMVMRFAPGSTNAQELFNASGRRDGTGGRGGTISSILAASDGTIWVTAGASLFRWSDGKAQEFSMFDDEAKFPVRADQLARVVETVNGKIWVVASNDSHRFYRGNSLMGGLLEWNGEAFVRREDLETSQWFLSSYTRTAPGEAIVGTPRGLAVHRGGAVVPVDGEREPSYGALRARQPMLFSGTRGTKFGEDGWLFGTAGGVVGYYKGQWIAPNRLNWLLPDNHLSQYGARMVHGVGADPKGRILVGTDRGLMIYQSAGESFFQFLVNENLPEMAFAALETQKLAAESASLLSALPPDSKIAAQVRKFEASARAVDQAQLALAEGADATIALRGGSGGMAHTAASELREGRSTDAAKPDLAAELARRQAAHKQLLSDIERDNKSLYQMLELKPLDLDAWRRRLGQGEVVVQYLPTPTKLIIHIASREESVIREVQIGSAELDQRATRLSSALASQARTLGLRAPDVDEGSAGAPVPTGAARLAAYDHQAELHWLYQQLLRPIEHDVARYTDIYIAPVGSLTRVPFAALIRTPGPKPEYAAQRFTLGVVPSLYLLDLVLNGGSRSGAGVALFGNPDGTLPGAEAETRSISQIVGPGSKMRIRGEATIDAVRGLATGSKWVHFATHGVLDGQDPSRSYLVLAGGRRLSVIDAMQLDLSQTEMVVLSACESGVGTSGLEYATLTRAFAHAGATSIIASLWKVDDASTKSLMERFYTHRGAGMRPFRALAEAQRDLLNESGPLAEPAAWSSFLAFGRN